VKITRYPLVLLACAVAAPLSAQDVPPTQTEPPGPPPRLAEVELARSRSCVPALARLEAVDRALEPLVGRAERVRALLAAVALEDTVRVTPLDPSAELEEAVRQWYVADQALAERYVREADEAVQDQRVAERERMEERLREVADDLDGRVERALAAVSGELGEATVECEDAVFVRSAVLEVCDTTVSPVCAAARATEAPARFRFVEDPEDLWDVEQLRPWSEPTSLFLTPGGTLGGARTSAHVRRGNLVLGVQLEPMIRPRSAVSEEQAAQFDANLDSLGFTFDDPRFVMAPALALRLNATRPFGDETHYFLHFGDLSDPPNQVVWQAPLTTGEPVRVAFPAPGWALTRMAEGDPLHLTAVAFAEGPEGRATAVYSLLLPSIGQARSLAALLSYMGSGRLARDLATLVPPSESGGSSGHGAG